MKNKPFTFTSFTSHTKTWLFWNISPVNNRLRVTYYSHQVADGFLSRHQVYVVPLRRRVLLCSCVRTTTKAPRNFLVPPHPSNLMHNWNNNNVIILPTRLTTRRQNFPDSYSHYYLSLELAPSHPTSSPLYLAMLCCGSFLCASLYIKYSVDKNSLSHHMIDRYPTQFVCSTSPHISSRALKLAATDHVLDRQR